MNKDLSKLQKEICNESGNFVVRACPGSGKTFTVSAKLAELIETWKFKHQGIAALSFTNVAWKEIQKELDDTFNSNIPIQHPHFLGTIDSFINKHIFFPYYYLSYDFKEIPRLVGEPSFSWKIKNNDLDYYQYFDMISYDINGDLIPTVSVYNKTFHFKIPKINGKHKLKKFKANGELDGHYANILNMKNKFHKVNFVTQDDINYFSMKILENHPNISKILSLRFPFILVDESQDTSDIQMKILKSIINHDNRKGAIFVGDPDQAIFEWKEASPELFKDLSNKWKTIEMNENWRSSKNICDFTFNFSSLNEPSISVDKDIKNYHFFPKIIGYSEDKISSLIEYFVRICEENEIEINPDKIAILARSKNLLKELLNEKSEVNKIEWIKNKFTKELARSKYLYDANSFKKSYDTLKYAYLCIIKDKKSLSAENIGDLTDEIGYFKLNNDLRKILKLMPNTKNISINNWINSFKKNLNKSNINLTYIRRFKRNLACPESIKNCKFNELFEYDDAQYNFRLSTIHKVKGETFEAILLVLKTKASSENIYSKILHETEDYINNEELRNIYVGITRPRKILVIAVPEKDLRVWCDNFKINLPNKRNELWYKEFDKPIQYNLDMFV